jgi:nitroreductase
MNYAALIQNRKSVRAFTDQYVPFEVMDKIKVYHAASVRRLLPEVNTALRVFGLEARAALEGAAGYNRFLVGAPQYMVLLSEKHPQSHLNAGYMMEDLILKATDLNLDTCWLTFADSEEVKESLGIESDLDVVAMAAFGYGAKVLKRIRLNIRSMSNVDVVAKHKYMEPKLRVQDMTYVDSWGNSQNLCQRIGFYDDVLSGKTKYYSNLIAAVEE